MNNMENQSLNEHPEHVKELLRIFARGEMEIARGKGFDMGTVIAEADALLAEEPVIAT